jgi:hypothetical protein
LEFCCQAKAHCFTNSNRGLSRSFLISSTSKIQVKILEGLFGVPLPNKNALLEQQQRL